MVDPLHHTASGDNIADLATKGKVHKDQVDVNSEWQDGPSYLSYERDSSWPINRDMLHGHDSIPANERLVKVFHVSSVEHVENIQLFEIIRWVAERHRDLNKVLRIVARFLIAARLSDRSKVQIEPTPVILQNARFLLEIIYGQDTAIKVLEGKLVGLEPILSKGRYVTRGRFGRGIAIILVIVELPILLSDSHLAYLIMVNAHEETHNGAKSTLA